MCPFFSNSSALPLFKSRGNSGLCNMKKVK
jgi:hypothetical protein